MTQDNTEVEIDSIEVGDEIEWTYGGREHRATVTDIGTTFAGNAMLGTKHEVRHFELDMIRGEEWGKITEENIEDSDHFEVVDSDDEGGDDDDDREIVTDGGEDVTGHFTDEEIEESIESNDNPDHPEAWAVEEVRDALAQVQHSHERLWAEHMDSVEEGHLEVVAETDQMIVFADHTGHGWGEELDLLEMELSPDGTLVRILAQIHHTAAGNFTDYSWATADAFVVRKPEGVREGELLTDSMLAWLMGEHDLSGSVALDWFMVEHRGLSQSEWGRRAGKDQGTISDNVSKAKRRLPR